MTLSDLPEHLAGIRERIIQQGKERVALAAATAMKAEMIDRIFNRGEASDGSAIGDYSTKPGYYTKEQFVRKAAFKPQGKNGFKGEKVVYNKQTGKGKIVKKKPQSMYLKAGYTEFRDIQGRKTNTKNYKLTGSLEKSIQVYKDQQDIIIAIKDKHESDKRHGLEAQDGKAVFKPSAKDIKVYKDAIKNEVEYLRNNI
jgi:hypothetical protein